METETEILRVYIDKESVVAAPGTGRVGVIVGKPNADGLVRVDWYEFIKPTMVRLDRIRPGE